MTQHTAVGAIIESSHSHIVEPPCIRETPSAFASCRRVYPFSLLAAVPREFRQRAVRRNKPIFLNAGFIHHAAIGTPRVPCAAMIEVVS